MIRDDAQKLAGQLNERLGKHAPGVVAEVEAASTRPEFHAPGGARPAFVRYKILIKDAAHTAKLSLDNAETLLGDLDPAWGPDRIFEEITSRGWAEP